MSPRHDDADRLRACGTLSSTNIVTRQAEALIRRSDLLDALTTDGEPRRDLKPSSPVDVRLCEVIARQLVPWVDYVPDTDQDGGWPIPDGVRVEAMCYSPWLDSLREPDGKIAGKRVFVLPDSANAFAQQFYIRAGIARDIGAEMQDVFHLTPLAAGAVAMQLRGDAEQPSRAFLLLLSRHFKEACDADERLLAPHPELQKYGFEEPAIVAFERLSELARAGMIVREVERHAHTGEMLRLLLERANDPDFIKTSPHPIPGVAYSHEIVEALACDPTLLTLCEYLACGTDVLASWRNANIGDRGTFQEGFLPAAVLNDGCIDWDTAAALAYMVDVRTAFLSAFRTPTESGAGSRQSALDNDILFKFFGMTGRNDNLGAVFIGDFRTIRSGGRPANTAPKKQAGDDSRATQATIVAHLGRDGALGKMSQSAVRNGAALSWLYLPKPRQPGAAGRADETLWRDRHRDQEFWRCIQDLDVSLVKSLGLRSREEVRLQSAIASFRELVLASMPSAPSALTARVIADLATAVSPIAVNPTLAGAIKHLATVNAYLTKLSRSEKDMSERRKDARKKFKERGQVQALGLREIPGIEGFTKQYIKKAGVKSPK